MDLIESRTISLGKFIRIVGNKLSDYPSFSLLLRPTIITLLTCYLNPPENPSPRTKITPAIIRFLDFVRST